MTELDWELPVTTVAEQDLPARGGARSARSRSTWRRASRSGRGC